MEKKEEEEATRPSATRNSLRGGHAAPIVLMGRAVSRATLVKVAVWAVLQSLFCWWEFGLVFFIGSMLYAVWDSMSSSSSSDRTPSGEERMSAYSVFNKGVTALPGTLNASEFDSMMRGGGGLVVPAPTEHQQQRSRSSGEWGQRDEEGDVRLEEEDVAAQRAAFASLKHVDRRTAGSGTSRSSKSSPATKKASKASSSSSSSSSLSSAPKPLVFDSDLQAILRSVKKP